MSDTIEQASTKRRMPETLAKYLLRMQGGKAYLPAAFRLVWFRDDCPDWGIETFIMEGGQEAGFATVRAVVRNENDRIIASAHKTETRQDFPAGWVEKAETGAVARALAITGFGTQFSSDIDEEGHVADAPQPVSRPQTRSQPAPVQLIGIWDGPGQCPSCHAPAGKPHGKGCTL